MSFFARITSLVLKCNEASIRQCSFNYCTGILDGVNVLDMSRIIAGPFCSMMLGDLGANVLKVESLEGDEARKWGPPFINGTHDSFYFLSVNRNKKSICINLKTNEGKAILYDIAKRSDIMVENFVPGKLEALGVGYRQLSPLNPQLIYCAITGYGSTGPYAHRPGYDVIASAVGGLMNATGAKNGDPVKVGVAITDVTTGLHAFGAIMAALYHRQKSGRGQKIDCDLVSTQISSMINIASVYLNTGLEPKRWGTEHPNIVPYQGFKTTDGYLVLGAGSNAQFTALCTLIDKKELASDDRFKTNSGRVENREELIRILSEMFESKTTKEWSNIFKDAPFPNGPLNKMKDVFDDEHVRAIGLVKELPHPDAGSVRLVGPPTVYSEGGNEARTAPPTLGQHTRNILTSFLHYSEEKEAPTTERVAVLTLRPAAHTQSKKKVVWTEDTVDNEDMNKKKSKCCCIYEKRRKFDESDSEDSEDECEHCFGHVERRHMQGHLQAHRDAAAASTHLQEFPAAQTEPTATTVLQPPTEPAATGDPPPPAPTPPPAVAQ